jgi:hypothetical protein
MFLMFQMTTKHKAVTRMINILEEFAEFKGLLIRDGYIFVKKVTKISNKTGCVYLPERCIGKTFRIILIPADDDDVYDKGRYISHPTSGFAVKPNTKKNDKVSAVSPPADVGVDDDVERPDPIESGRTPIDLSATGE